MNARCKPIPFLTEYHFNGRVDFGALGLVDKIGVNLMHERIKALKNALRLKEGVGVVVEHLQGVDVWRVKQEFTGRVVDLGGSVGEKVFDLKGTDVVELASDGGFDNRRLGVLLHGRGELLHALHLSPRR